MALISVSVFETMFSVVLKNNMVATDTISLLLIHFQWRGKQSIVCFCTIMTWKKLNMVKVFLSFFNVLPYLFLQTVYYVSNLTCFYCILRVILKTEGVIERRQMGLELERMFSWLLEKINTSINIIVFSDYYIQVVKNRATFLCQ